MNHLMQWSLRAHAPKKAPLTPPPTRRGTSGYGAVMQRGPGVNFREGSLGSPMQRGQGTAFREGSLGAALSLSNDNMIFLAIGGILGIVAVKQGWVKKGFLGT